MLEVAILAWWQILPILHSKLAQIMYGIFQNNFAIANNNHVGSQRQFGDKHVFAFALHRKSKEKCHNILNLKIKNNVTYR